MKILPVILCVGFLSGCAELDVRNISSIARYYVDEKNDRVAVLYAELAQITDIIAAQRERKYIDWNCRLISFRQWMEKWSYRPEEWEKLCTARNITPFTVDPNMTMGEFMKRYAGKK